jgi:hypothetical protein
MIGIIPQNTTAVLEMVQTPIIHTASASTDYVRTSMPFGTNHIDGTTSYSWQVVASCTVNSTIRLKNGATNVSSVAVPSTTTTPTMFTAAVSNASVSADSTWLLRIEGQNCSIYSSKIIVTQTGATKTQLYIPLTSINSAAATPFVSTNSGTPTQPNAINFPTYNWQKVNLSRIESVTLLLTQDNQSGPGGCLGLYNKTTNTLIGAEVCNSSTAEVVLTGAIPVASMPATAELEVRMYTSNTGKTWNLYKAGLIVRLVSIERNEMIQQVGGAVTAMSASSNLVEYRSTGYQNGFGSATVNEYVRCRARASAAGSSSFIYKDHGTNTSGATGTTITASSMNFTNQASFTTVEAGPVVTTSGNNTYMNFTRTSGTFELSNCLHIHQATY